MRSGAVLILVALAFVLASCSFSPFHRAASGLANVGSDIADSANASNVTVPLPTQQNASANATANASNELELNTSEPKVVSPRARLNTSLLGIVPSSDPSPRIVSFSLMSAAANTPIPGYVNVTGTVKIERQKLPTRLSVRANYAGDVGSVLFALDDDPFHRVENEPPFALNGDDAGNYYAWTPSKGRYVITATPYVRTDAKGPAGKNLTVIFEFFAQGYLSGAEG